MGFTSSNLSVLSYANNFTLWHYVTEDKDVTEDGYFNKGADMLRVNDIIIANVDTKGEPRTVFYVVVANAGGSIVVKPY